MKDIGIEPLPPEIAEILTREAAGYPDDPAMKAAVLARTELAVALGAAAGAGGAGLGMLDGESGRGAAALAGHAGAFGGRALAAVGLLAFLAGGVAGGLIARSVALGRGQSVPASAAPSAARTPSSAEPPTPSAAGTPTISASAAPSASVAPSASAAPSATAPRGDLIRERELLDAAHAALARGRAADALAAAERHAAQWPRGYLGEEREVVIIQALVAAGRRGEAAPRAERFRKAHPKSMLLPVVDAAVAPAP